MLLDPQLPPLISRRSNRPAPTIINEQQAAPEVLLTAQVQAQRTVHIPAVAGGVGQFRLATLTTYRVVHRFEPMMASTCAGTILGSLFDWQHYS